MRQLGTLHPGSGSREMKADVTLASLSPSDSVLDPVYGMILLTFRVNLPYSAKLGWKQPHRRAQMCLLGDCKASQIDHQDELSYTVMPCQLI